MSEKGRGNPLLLLLVITPLVIAPLVLAGAYLGFYVGDSTGYSRSILAISFSTVGFLVSIFILVRVIRWIVARNSAATGRSS